MEIDPQLLDKVKKSNEEFKLLYEEHTQLKSKVEDFNKMKFLSPDQEIEKKKIQVQKLKLKDRMDEILSEHQANLH